MNTSVVHLLQDHANFWNASLAKSTKDTYQVGERRYLRFCAQLRVAPFPLSERMLELFATSLARCVGHKTIRTYLLGAQARNFDLGFWQPLSSFHRLAFLLRGIRRSQGSSHSRPVRAPVSLAGVQKVVAFVRWHRSDFDASMLSAALLAAFFGLLRASEYASPSARTWWPRLTLSAADVSFDGRLGVASIRLKVSKTDPFGAGTVVRIVASGGVFCPYAALLRFSQIRGSFPGPFFYLFGWLAAHTWLHSGSVKISLTWSFAEFTLAPEGWSISTGGHGLFGVCDSVGWEVAVIRIFTLHRFR